MFYFQLNIGEYSAHTSGLTLLEHGVYFKLLQLYYTEEKPLTGDICRAIGARLDEEREAVEYILQTFFKATESGYIQSGADKRIAEFRAKSAKAKQSAQISVEARNRKANAERTLSERIEKVERTLPKEQANAELTNNHKPITNNHSLGLPAKAPTPKGKRLTADWKLPDEYKQWAIQQGHYPDEVIRAEAEKFKDYFLSASGQNASKVDWFATWRNWLRRCPKATKRQTSKDSVGFIERHTSKDWAEGLGT